MVAAFSASGTSPALTTTCTASAEVFWVCVAYFEMIKSVSDTTEYNGGRTELCNGDFQD